MIPPGTEAALLDSWDYFLHLAMVLTPLFIGASFLVGLAQEYLPPERVEEMLRARDHGSGNVLAAGLGAVTPFCSCSTVPVLAGLLGAGAPTGMAFSFLLASPIVNWIAVFLLFGLFGTGVTVAYVTTALLAAIVAGLIIGTFELDGYIKDVRITAGGREIATDGGATPSDASGAADAGGCSECGTTTTNRTHKERVIAAGEGALSFFRDTLPYIAVGIAIGALIHGAVPAEFLQQIAGPGNPLATPIAALAGAPIYVSISGMLPIAHSLTEAGIPIGTVIAFVIGGAGISIPNLILLNKLFERRLLAIYATTVVTIGITVGVLFNTVFAGLL
ncbi:permease [Halorubrum distributum]|uniref:Permease n=1 Tax=Halorubrum distributum TaxID=29283 RepID=A0A6B1IE17_9EURY|nr:permease [Halorubrum terrestre]MYL17469.1 permease [Halorubrum terrestre]MYL67212.1 permease [Halorubrum terrestre]